MVSSVAAQKNRASEDFIDSGCVRFGYYRPHLLHLFNNAGTRQERKQNELAKLTAANAVSVLPFGTQEAWVAYVDRRFAEAIQFKAGAISVNDKSHEAKFISLNTPYQVSCSPALGGSVEFGYGDGAVKLQCRFMVG